MVSNRFQQISDEINKKYFYLIKISKTPTRINYHHFDFNQLNEISRKLTNGLSTLGLVPNRKFWNKYFLGGVRTISIKQEEHNDYPTFTINYLVFSDTDNLDVRIRTSLNTRVKRIDPTLDTSFKYLGCGSNLKIDDYIDSGTDVDFGNPNLKKLGETIFDDIFNNQYQRPRFLGELFKTNK